MPQVLICLFFQAWSLCGWLDLRFFTCPSHTSFLHPTYLVHWAPYFTDGLCFHVLGMHLPQVKLFNSSPMKFLLLSQRKLLLLTSPLQVQTSWFEKKKVQTSWWVTVWLSVTGLHIFGPESILWSMHYCTLPQDGSNFRYIVFFRYIRFCCPL